MKNRKALLLCILAACLMIFPACSTDAPSEPNDQTVQTEAGTPAEAPTVTDLTETPAETEVITDPPADAVLRPSDFTTDLYSVTKIDGVCYLNFNDGNQVSAGDGDLNYEVIGAYYDSFEEFRNTLLGGDLSENTINSIKQQFEKTEQGIVVLDIVNMGKPVLPTDCTIGRLCWTGRSLSVDVDSNAYGGWGNLFLQTDAVYEEFYTMIYGNSAGDDTVITDGTFEDVPCKIYDIKNSSGHTRDIKFEVSRGDQTFQICLTYIIDSYRDIFPESEEHPHSAAIFSESNGQKYFIQLYDLQDTPTLDWLTSFVLAPVSDDLEAAS